LELLLLLNAKCPINEKDEDGVTALILGIFDLLFAKKILLFS
jgi:hypothetical protein